MKFNTKNDLIEGTKISEVTSITATKPNYGNQCNHLSILHMQCAFSKQINTKLCF